MYTLVNRGINFTILQLTIQITESHKKKKKLYTVLTILHRNSYFQHAHDDWLNVTCSFVILFS